MRGLSSLPDCQAALSHQLAVSLPVYAITPLCNAVPDFPVLLDSDDEAVVDDVELTVIVLVDVAADVVRLRAVSDDHVRVALDDVLAVGVELVLEEEHGLSLLLPEGLPLLVV